MSSSEHSFTKYQHIAKLRGGDGTEVLLAAMRGPAGFNKLYVVKQLSPTLAEGIEPVKMLLDEARLAARLNHPNVVQTNEVFEVDGRYAIAMEYLEGHSFYAITKRLAKTERVMPRPLFLRIFRDMLEGLHYAHEFTDYDGTPLEIVHRDVSPQNLFVTYDGQVKVVDFGIAIANSRSIRTTIGVIKGKVQYMAPEQIHGSAATDRRADVFAAGAMLYEVLSGRQLWGDASDVSIVSQLIAGNVPRSPKEINPSVPDALDHICARALAPMREDRYPTAAALEQAIEEYVTSSSEGAEQRDVGQFVSEVFEVDRKTIRRLIGECIKASYTEAVHSEPPQKSRRLPPDGSDTVSSAPEAADSGPQSRPGASPTDRLKSPTTNFTPTPTPSLAPVEHTVHASLPRGFLRERRTQRFGGITAALAAVGLGYLLFRMLAPPLRDAFSLAAAPATLPAASSKTREPAGADLPSPRPAPPDAVQIKAETVPAAARLFLDDTPVPSNPFTGKFPKDGLYHRLHAESSGYASKTEVVRFDQDVTVRLELDKERPRTTPANKPVRPGPPQNVLEQPPAPVSSTQALSIDRGDPWAP